MHRQTDSTRLRHRQSGFTSLDTLMVIAISLTISAIAVPQVYRQLWRYEAASSAQRVAGVLLRARSEAINRNKLITVKFWPTAATPRYGTDLNGDGVLQATEPFIVLPSNVQMTNVGAPVLTSMGATYDCAPWCPPLPSAADFAVTFAARGTVVQPVTSGGQTVWIEAGSVYVFFFHHTMSGAWYAVTLTPSCRTRVWQWNGTAWGLS